MSNTVTFLDDDEACNCPICLSYNTGDANDASTPTEAEIDEELDQIINDILSDSIKNTAVPVDAPIDVNMMFDAIFGKKEDEAFIAAFGRDAPSHDARDYPIGPISFSVDEIESICRALRFHGTYIVEKALAVTDSKNDDIINAFPADVSYEFNKLISDAVDMSEENLRLYDFLSDIVAEKL